MIDNLSRVYPVSAKLFLNKSFKIHSFFAPLASLPNKIAGEDSYLPAVEVPFRINGVRGLLYSNRACRSNDKYNSLPIDSHQ